MALQTASPYNNERSPELNDSNEDTDDSNELKPVPWLSISRDAYDTSETWFEAAVRDSLERNISHFQGRHAPGSKYYSKQYQHRAKGFRPKTRAIVRKNEALAANAYFATSNLLSVTADNSGNIVQRVSAEINKEILEYRLRTTIPWYKILIGAYQDTMVNGVCISHQFWDYQESVRSVPLYGDDGQEVLDEEGQPAYEEDIQVIKDTPAIELRPLENVRFAPAANWLDPMNTSPFIIDRIPMDIGSILQMTKNKGKSKIPWHEMTIGQLQAGRSDTTTDDGVKRQRDRARLDPIEENSYLHQEFNTVWVHRNIVNYEGRDWIYYTAGTYFLMSDPIPLEEQYPHLKAGERPYVMGMSTLEAHKNYPEGITGISSGLQQEANELSNQRRDNVSLVLNKRYYVKRGQGVDVKALQRNVPGGVVFANNVDSDVRSESPADVTSSSYQEQDRINADLDDVSGNFSVGSVGTNRQLNETVGGMELMSGDADILTEYQLRTFNSTWAEQTLSQVLRLEQRHETDDAIFKMVGDKIDMWQRYGVDEIQDDMLQGGMTVEINVGFGATNPSQRVQRLTTGIQAVQAFAPKMASRIDEEEIAKEVFGAIGFKDGSRFFISESPEPPVDPMVQLEQLRQQGAQQIEQLKHQNAMELEAFDTENDLRKENAKMQKDMSDKALKVSMEDRKLEGQERDRMTKADIESQKQKMRLSETAIKQRNENRRFDAEVELKRQEGTGI